MKTSDSSEHRYFLSLRWKMFILLSAVLFIVHAVYSVVIYQHEKRKFYDQRVQVNERDGETLDGLVQSSYEQLLGLAEMLALMSDEPKSIVDVSQVLETHFDELQLNGSLSAVYLFDNGGELVGAMGMPLNLNDNLVKGVLETEKPARDLICARDCLRYVAIPIQLTGNQLGVLVVGRVLIDIVLAFNSEQSRSIGLAFKVAPPDGDLPEMGLSLRYLTEKSQNLKVLREFSKRFEFKGEGGVYPFDHDGRYYEVAVSIPLGLEQEVAYWLLIDDLTEDYQSLWSDIFYRFLLIGCGLVIVALFQFSALGSSFRNIEKLASILPRLAESKGRHFKSTNLLVHRAPIFRDELDSLVVGVDDLIGELNKLDIQYRLKVKELQRSATVAKREGDFVQSLLDTAQVIIMIQAGDGKVHSMNHYGQRILGIASDSFSEKGVYFRDLLADGEDLPFEQKAIADICAGRLSQNHVELRIKSSGLGELDFAWVHSRLQGDSTREPAVLSMGIDITDRKNSERRVYWLANHNSLTNLPNRNAISSAIASRISLARGRDTSFGVLLCGLDGFKGINDSMGHEFGDNLLKAAAKRFSEVLSSEGMVAHFSSDQFMLMTTMSDSENIHGELKRLVAKVLTAFRMPFHVEEYEIYSTMSVGISIYPYHGHDEIDLVRHADIAMYQAKELGKNQSRFYDELLGEQEESRFTLKSDLYKVVEREQLLVYYQPQVDVNTGKVFGVEALVRWHHPEIGLISPVQFIPLAEETGLIWDIGRWVLQESCQQLVAWQAQGITDLCVSVNLSKQQLFNEMLLPLVDEVLAETGLDPKYLDFEITENFLMKQPSRVLPKLQQLRSKGITVSMDDFGTGFSSLSHLRDLPIDRLKIDQSFVRDLAEDEKARAVIEAIIVLGKSLGVAVLAEGVETKEQLNLLADLNCTEIQGYYFSRPLPAFQAINYLKQDDE